MKPNPTQEFFTGLRRVTEDCYAAFAPYYAQRQQHYVYPVYYQSVTQMVAAGGFFWKVFIRDGRRTLAVFKRSSIMGNYSVMLHIAPISLSGNRDDELWVMQTARRLGVTLKLCAEDIRRYHVPFRLCDPIRGNLEYVYDAQEIVAMAGGKFHGFRRAVRKVLGAEGYRHTYGVNDDIAPVVAAWDARNKAQGRTGVQSPHWRKIAALSAPQLRIHSVYVGGRLESFSVIEQVSPKHWVLVMGVRNYDSPLNDVNKAMHFLDCQIAAEAHTGVGTVYANIGAAIGLDGLDAEKEHLKPCAHQQIYRMGATQKLDTQTVKSIFANL